MKDSTPTCRYKAPLSTQENSKKKLATNGHPTYTPARNDDRLNLHNPKILSIWRANVDFQIIFQLMQYSNTL